MRLFREVYESENHHTFVFSQLVWTFPEALGNFLPRTHEQGLPAAK